MKSETLFAQNSDSYNLRYVLARTAKGMNVPGLSFREAFNSPVQSKNQGEESLEKRLHQLGISDIGRHYLTGFGESEMAGRIDNTRNIYATNDGTKLVVIDEQTIESSALEGRIISLISDITDQEWTLICADISKLENKMFY